MASVVGLLESGSIEGNSAGACRTAAKIINLCRAEQQRQLLRYDKALAGIEGGAA